MAEQRSRRSQNGSRRNSRLSGREVIERVRRELPALLGHPVESVLGLEPEHGLDRMAEQRGQFAADALDHLPPRQAGIGAASRSVLTAP